MADSLVALYLYPGPCVLCPGVREGRRGIGTVEYSQTEHGRLAGDMVANSGFKHYHTT